jgi:hypothetical protein
MSETLDERNNDEDRVSEEEGGETEIGGKKDGGGIPLKKIQTKGGGLNSRKRKRQSHDHHRRGGPIGEKVQPQSASKDSNGAKEVEKERKHVAISKTGIGKHMTIKHKAKTAIQHKSEL